MSGQADHGPGNDREQGDDEQGPGDRNGHPNPTGGSGAARPPRIPPPRAAADDCPPPPALPGPRTDDADRPPQTAPAPQPPRFEHQTLGSLLGAWALAACSPEEAAAVEEHLTDCATCAEEALRLRDAVRLLHPEDSLDLDPTLRTRVLDDCLQRRPARIPVPEWVAPYDAETARLDALLRDMAAAEWRTPVALRWFDGERQRSRETTVAGVIGHLLAVDGLVATALGLPDPLGDATATPGGPTERTEACWRSWLPPAAASGGERVRGPWHEQARALIRTASVAEECPGAVHLDRGADGLTLPDAFLDRAFACWVHADDIAAAIEYPYGLPEGRHLRPLIDLAARRIPDGIADRRRAGLAPPPQRLAAAGRPGRTLHLEVEGSGGGHWYLPLDSPAALAAPDHTVAHVALDAWEFCRLAAGHVPPPEAAAGREGDHEAISDALFAVAALSRL